MTEDSLPRKTIRVMQEVAAHEDGIGLSELSRQTGIPKATCYRILQVLEDEQWLSLHPETRRYRVGLRVLSIVGSLMDRGIYPAVRSVLESVAEDAMETSGFDLLTPPEIKVLIQVSGPAVIGQSPRPVPRNQSVWDTASGKAALALLPREQIDELFCNDFMVNVSPEVPAFERYVDSLAAVRERGYAVAIDELEVGASAVAAAVPADGRLPYAVWIGGPTFRFTKERLEELGALTVRAARELERLIALDQSDQPLG